jgi:vanillate O-demethylase ferredoxin subunit
MQLRVRSITYLAEAISGYELVDPRGRDLPRFAAGAHIDLRFDDLVRQYSLCNDPAERRRYCVAVLREDASRGGSRYLHDTIRAGDLLEVSMPRNNFALESAADRHLLIAGGIGIAPIMSMIAELQRRRADFQLHYCTRSAARTAFRHELALTTADGRVHFHHDGGDPARGLDIKAVLRDPPQGTHLYYCGPAGLMAAAAEAAKGWAAGTVHSEYFTAPPAASVVEDKPFRVRLAKRGVEYEIPVGQTIVGVLRRHGVTVPTSCELGYCGACVTRYLAGEPDHRDQVLREYGRGRFVLICCARSKTPVLDLDL